MPKKRKRLDITIHSYFKGGYAPQYTNVFAYGRGNNHGGTYAASHEQSNANFTGAPAVGAKKQNRLNAGRTFDSAPEAILTQLIEQSRGADKSKLTKLKAKSYGQKQNKIADYRWGDFSADLQEAGYIVNLSDKVTDDAKFMARNAETVYTGYESYKNDPSTVLGFREKNKDSKGWGSRPISKSSTDEDIKAFDKFDKLMSKKNPKYKNMDISMVANAFQAYRKDPKKFKEDLGNLTQKFTLKAKIKNAVSKSKSFKMPKAKTNKGGAGGGLGFKLKKR